MQRKTNFVALLFICLVLSCSKNDSPPVPPPTPPVGPPIDTAVTILVATDSLGIGWQKIKVDTTIDFSDIFFVDNQVGFLCGERYVGKSSDGGITWKKVIPETFRSRFVNIFFVDNNNGWVFGLDYSLRTKDGGSTWEKIDKPNLFDGFFFDANNGYITADDGKLYKTFDGGVTLQIVTKTFSRALFFVDKNKGWIAGDGLAKTNDACVSFSKSSNLDLREPYAIQFTDELHGWLAGPNTYRTEDGGVSLQLIKQSYASGDIHFFDNNNGFILSGNKIFSTKDGGKTLQQVCMTNKISLFEIHFTDPNHGWATGTGGYVYKYVKP